MENKCTKGNTKEPCKSQTTQIHTLTLIALFAQTPEKRNNTVLSMTKVSVLAGVLIIRKKGRPTPITIKKVKEIFVTIKD